MVAVIARKFAAPALAFMIFHVAAAGLPAWSQARGGVYDMSRFLNEPHPFAVAQPAPPITTPAPVRIQPPPTIALPAKPVIVPRARRPAGPRREPPPEARGGGIADYVSEIRAGLFLHDSGVFSANEEGGYDGNLEILFPAPDLLSFMWSPRPHIGASVSSDNNTDQAYLGLTWQWPFLSGFFAELGLGAMVHNGHLVGVDGGPNPSKSLGCRFLFREAIDIGYKFNERHAVMVHLDHSSNASLCKKNTRDGTAEGRHTVTVNEGLESFGVRYGYIF